MNQSASAQQENRGPHLGQQQVQWTPKRYEKEPIGLESHMWSAEAKVWVWVEAGASSHDAHSAVNEKTRVAASDSSLGFLENLQMGMFSLSGMVGLALKGQGGVGSLSVTVSIQKGMRHSCVNPW